MDQSPTARNRDARFRMAGIRDRWDHRPGNVLES